MLSNVLFSYDHTQLICSSTDMYLVLCSNLIISYACTIHMVQRRYVSQHSCSFTHVVHNSSKSDACRFSVLQYVSTTHNEYMPHNTTNICEAQRDLNQRSGVSNFKRVRRQSYASGLVPSSVASFSKRNSCFVYERGQSSVFQHLGFCNSYFVYERVRLQHLVI